MVDDLIVIAAHGPEFAMSCKIAAMSMCDAPIVLIDTGSGTVPTADVVLDGGHPTGAYLYAYENYPADHYLFIQDSMIAIQPFLDHFKVQRAAGDAVVAWAIFGMAYDNDEQLRWVTDQYPDCEEPQYGIWGPSFYTSCDNLEALDEAGLLPKIPTNKLEAQGTERAWSWAFHCANIPVVGPYWNPEQMQSGGFPPFRKIFANRQ